MPSNQLKAVRERVGLTQSGLAEACGWGCNQSRISNYEQGRSHPRLQDCRIIVGALNVAGAGVELDDVFPPESESTEVA